MQANRTCAANSIMAQPKITRLPSQATHGGRRPRPEAFASRQERESREEAYLIDGRQPYRY